VRRGFRVATIVVCGIGSVGLAGCPAHAPPPVAKSVATVKASELPADAAGLNAYCDEQFKSPSPTSMENCLVAVEKALAVEKGYESLWRGARAAEWLAEQYDEDHKRERADYAQKCLDYAKPATETNTRGAWGWYLLGACTGRIAQSQAKGGAEAVKKIDEAAKNAVELDPRVDHAGPLRLQGSLYAKAPNNMASGGLDEGLASLKRAIDLAPNDPENHLELGDALLKDGSLDDAEKQYRAVLNAQPLPEWGKRLDQWKKAAEAGIKKVETKRRQKSGSGGGDNPF
jgi:tetratricopeptide (TPR) repeat protein